MAVEYETIEVVIKEAQLLIFERDYGRTLALLEDTLAKIEAPGGELENDSGNECLCFDNPLEESLYRELYQPTKDICVVPADYAGIYYLYGIVLVALNRLAEAEGALIKSSRWNPIMVEPMLELGELYKKKQLYQEYFAITNQCLERAYKSEDIARCYRNLGYYYIYQGDFEMAIASYCFSTEFSEENEKAETELLYIAERTDQDVNPPSLETLEELFAENGIQLGANKLVLQTAIALGNQALEAEDYETAKYFYSVLYELTGRETVRELIDALPSAAN
jgi:tetratricopeptide (TPR) repeat protein